MGLHLDIAAIRGSGVDVRSVAESLGLIREDREASFDELTQRRYEWSSFVYANTDCYFAQHGDWVICVHVSEWKWLVQRHGDPLKGLAAALPLAEVFFFVWEGASDTYFFGAARAGEVTREVSFIEGERLEDGREPLAWEGEAVRAGMSPEDGEGYVLELLEQNVVPYETLEALSFAVYTRPRELTGWRRSASELVGSMRGWLRRSE